MTVEGAGTDTGNAVPAVENSISEAAVQEFTNEQLARELHQFHERLYSIVWEQMMLSDYARALISRNQNLIGWLQRIELQPVFVSILATIESGDFLRLASSKGCSQVLRRMHNTLDHYQCSIKDTQKGIESLLTGSDTNDTAFNRNDRIRDVLRKVAGLCTSLGLTIMSTTFFIQQQTGRGMNEPREMITVPKSNTENPTSLNLKSAWPSSGSSLQESDLVPESKIALFKSVSPSCHTGRDRPNERISKTVLDPAPLDSTTSIESFATAKELISLSEPTKDTITSDFQIFIVGLPSFKSLVMRVTSDDTIGQIKIRIDEKVFTRAVYSLFYRGRHLDNNSTVLACGIENLATLAVSCRSVSSCWQPSAYAPVSPPHDRLILVKTFGQADNRFEILTKVDMTVGMFKRQIAGDIGILESEQRLISKGKQLGDHISMDVVDDTVWIVRWLGNKRTEENSSATTLMTGSKTKPKSPSTAPRFFGRRKR